MPLDVSRYGKPTSKIKYGYFTTITAMHQMAIVIVNTTSMPDRGRWFRQPSEG